MLHLNDNKKQLNHSYIHFLFTFHLYIICVCLPRLRYLLFSWLGPFFYFNKILDIFVFVDTPVCVCMVVLVISGGISS